MSSVFLNFCLLYFLGSLSSLNLELIQLDWLASEFQGSFSGQHRDDWYMPPCLAFLSVLAFTLR